MRQGNRASRSAAAIDTTPAAVADYRQHLSRGENIIDPQTFVADFSEVGSGYGGYNPDHGCWAREST